MNKLLLRFTVFLSLILGCAVAAHAQGVAVVVNSGVKATQISDGEVRDIFDGEKASLKDGSKVTPVILKSGEVHEAFLKYYMGKSDAAYRTAWQNLVFTGQGSMPKTFSSEAALLDYIAATPGAIGYASVASANHPGVKALAVRFSK